MAVPISIEPTEIPDVLELTSKAFLDERGFFTELYCEPVWRDAGLPIRFVQDNLSQSAKGVLRGLHYQLNPHGLDKFVRVLRGAVFDVAVDLRRDSPSFGGWIGRTLSAENGRALWIPNGFAHGFLALEDHSIVLYKQTGLYEPAAERSLIWNDPEVGIAWPEAPALISAKDRTAPRLERAEANFSL